MSRQRPVLIVENSTGVGGSTVSLLRLVGKLRESEFQPHVLFYLANDYLPKFHQLDVPVTLMREDLGRGRISTSASRNGGTRRGSKHVRSFVGMSRRLIRKDIPEALSIRDFIKQKGAYLVHINGRINSCRGAILASRLAHVPCICHVRDFYSFSPLDRWFSRWIDLFVYISKAVQEHTEQALPWAHGQLVYDGVDHAEFRTASDPTMARRDREYWGLSQADAVVGNVGRLVKWKGQHVFLQAIAEASVSMPGLKALVVGNPDPPEDTSYLAKLRSLTESLGIQDRVVLTGFVDDVPRLLATLDVLVHSSVKPEPFGLTVLEGMAAGLPVVATAAGGTLDMVQDGATGVLVPPGDPHSMSQALLRILSQPERASRMGKAGQECVARHFTIEQFAKGVERAYATVLP